jgi:hypothetical protein
MRTTEYHQRFCALLDGSDYGVVDGDVAFE